MNDITKKTEWYLYNFNAIKAAVHDRRAEMDAHKGMTGGISSHAYISDVTANKAIRNITPIRSVEINTTKGLCDVHNPEQVLQAIKYAVNQQDGLTRKVVEGRYIAKEIWHETAANLSISRDIYYECIKNFRYDASMCLVGFGVIDIREFCGSESGTIKVSQIFKKEE